jgi:hypothetical protein
LKKINRRNYLILPGTTTERVGIMYHKINFKDGVVGYFCLNQIRVISYKRFDKRYSPDSISDLDFYSIKNKLSDYYFGKLIPPPEAGGTEDDTAPHIKSIIPNTNILSNENL